MTTEAQVLECGIREGFSVLIPFGNRDSYDQVWDVDGKLLKIQVKTASLCKKNGEVRDNVIKFPCIVNRNGVIHKYGDDIDFFATVWDNVCYLVPSSECSIEKRLRLNTEGLPEHLLPFTCMAKDYECRTVLKRYGYLTEEEDEVLK